MAYKYLLLIYWLSIFGLVTQCEAKGSLKRKFAISSAYLEKIFNDNRGLISFPLSAIDGYSKIFDIATSGFNKGIGSRIALSLLELPIGFWFANSIFVPFHEFGHARFIKAAKGDYVFGSQGYGIDFGDISNYWLLSGIRLITPPLFFPGSGIGYASYTNEALEIPKKLWQRWGGESGVQILLSASGLNNQSYLAKRIADQIYADNGHITYLQHYVGNKISGFIYSQLDKNMNPTDDPSVQSDSDIAMLLTSYKAKNYNIAHKHIEFQSLLSIFSSTTISLFKGYYDYISTKNPIVYPLEFFGFRLPDLNSYINVKGLSFELVTGYRCTKDLFIDLAYEFVWRGENAHQVSPAAHFNLASVWPQLNELWLVGKLVIGNGLGGSLATHWAPWDMSTHSFWHRLCFFADLSLYNALNLHGERNIPRLSETGIALNGFIGTSIRY